MPEQIDVWIIEDNHYLRDTLAELLNQGSTTRCTLAAGDCETALAALEDGDLPRVVLMDLGLPGMSGLEGIRHIKSTSPASDIIVLTVEEDDQQVFEALCAGASGYLLKPASASDIKGAIWTAIDGGAPISPLIARRVLALFKEHVAPGQREEYGLTAREREILELLTEGRLQKQIAAALGISRHTVDTHLRNIYAKLHVHSRTAAVAKAIHERLI